LSTSQEYSVHPHHHHHAELLQRIARREAPVHREHLAVGRVEVRRHFSRHVHHHHVIEQQRRRDEAEAELDHVGPAHRERAALGERVEAEGDVDERRAHQQALSERAAPRAHQPRPPVLHGRQGMHPQHQVGHVAGDEQHQDEACREPQAPKLHTLEVKPVVFIGTPLLMGTQCKSVSA
jgi:hypothetical protein